MCDIYFPGSYTHTQTHTHTHTNVYIYTKPSKNRGEVHVV